MKYIIVILAVVAALNYDEALANQLTALSFAAYCQSDNILTWDVGTISQQYPYLSKIQIFENQELQTLGYIAYNSQTQAITIVFRGSNNMKNFIADIDTNKIDFNPVCNCQVHEGFFAAYTSLKVFVDALLPEYRVKYPFAKYHVTGHSLGGAIATLFSSELAYVGVANTLVTVGSPRVGDSNFYDWFSKLKITHSRLTNKKDIAPHLPRYKDGFEHVNTEVWYKDGVNYVVCEEVKGEDQTCSASVPMTNLSDHLNYLGWSSNSCTSAYE